MICSTAVLCGKSAPRDLVPSQPSPKVAQRYTMMSQSTCSPYMPKYVPWLLTCPKSFLHHVHTHLHTISGPKYTIAKPSHAVPGRVCLHHPQAQPSCPRPDLSAPSPRLSVSLSGLPIPPPLRIRWHGIMEAGSRILALPFPNVWARSLPFQVSGGHPIYAGWEN